MREILASKWAKEYLAMMVILAAIIAAIIYSNYYICKENLIHCILQFMQ